MLRCLLLGVFLFRVCLCVRKSDTVRSVSEMDKKQIEYPVMSREWMLQGLRTMTGTESRTKELLLERVRRLLAYEAGSRAGAEILYDPRAGNPEDVITVWFDESWECTGYTEYVMFLDRTKDTQHWMIGAVNYG